MTALAEPAPDRTRGAAGLRAAVSHPVVTTLAVALVLHLLWWPLLANSGGDIAAQDAWAEFARTHPGSAYNLAWYGGIHTASYSLISPFVMAALGVRTTMVLVGTLGSGLLALLVVRSRVLARPLVPCLVGAASLLGNAVSGRVTFGLGLMFSLAALAVVFAWPDRWRDEVRQHRLARGALVAILAALATAGSPVAGLFLGMIAAALWLDHRRAAACCLGLPPVLVVAASALVFPFSGRQPIHWPSIILPVILGVAVALVVPRQWRTARIGAWVYAVGVVLVWLVPSPIGTNVTRLALIFGGVLLVAVALAGGHRRRTAIVLAVAIATSGVWQVAIAARDVVTTAPDAAWSADVGALIRALQRREATKGRVEVVPPSSHRDAAALAPYFNLARGWNRQADAERNPLFYDTATPLTAESYRAWLDRWAVHYVVLPPGRPDSAAVEESALIQAGLPFLHLVWTNASWRLYAVAEPTTLVAWPGELVSFKETEVRIRMPYAAEVMVRIPWSPWLTLVDAAGHAVPMPSESTGNVDGCLSTLAVPDPPHDDWVVLEAPRAGIYRIAAPYSLRRGTPCPSQD